MLNAKNKPSRAGGSPAASYPKTSNPERMKRKLIVTGSSAVEERSSTSKSWSGSQTLLRGLAVLEAVASGLKSLDDVAAAVKLNRSTTHRLAGTLAARRYLIFVPRIGYGLGTKALELGHQARAQLDIPRIARDHLEKLAAETGDTVHLGVLEGNRCLYLDKLPGRRRVEVSSRVGELQPLRSTGLGKALLLDADDRQLRDFYRCEDNAADGYKISEATWIRQMQDYAEWGYAFDLEENEDRIRCVAAPVRDATLNIKAAISVSSAAQYMDDKRMQALAQKVRGLACQISQELGWKGGSSTDKGSRKP